MTKIYTWVAGHYSLKPNFNEKSTYFKFFETAKIVDDPNILLMLEKTEIGLLIIVVDKSLVFLKGLSLLIIFHSSEKLSLAFTGGIS